MGRTETPRINLWELCKSLQRSIGGECKECRIIIDATRYFDSYKFGRNFPFADSLSISTCYQYSVRW